MNMVQYCVLSIVPVMVLLKGVKHFIPEEDESKGSFELLAECVAQLGMILGGIWLSDRLVRYVPPYSGSQYQDFNPINFMLPLMLILLTMQTKLGSKLDILGNRAIDALRGTSEPSHSRGHVRVTQPISGGRSPTPDQLLPSNPQLTAMPQIPSDAGQLQHGNTMQNQAHGSMPDQMQNPMQNQMQNPAHSQGMVSEPVAANDGMFGGSAW